MEMYKIILETFDFKKLPNEKLICDINKENSITSFEFINLIESSENQEELLKNQKVFF
jgi:hypothetical protein